MTRTESSAKVQVDATALNFKELNSRLREAVAGGATHLDLHNVCGQRYIGTDLDGDLRLDIHGTPGNDLGAFMDGPTIVVHGNAQDGCGNTMNEGTIVVHGHAGDILGMSARGGKIFVRDDVGYRCAIHMKEYQSKKPIMVIGGTAQDFLAEYMAGGVLVLLGLTLKEGETHQAGFIGTGMHGGVVYIRGKVADHQLGKEVGVAELTEGDKEQLHGAVTEFASHFGYDAQELLKQPFIKLYARFLRPYGRLYAY